MLSLRLVPLTAALVERFLPSTQGPVAALGFWQLARRPQAYARSVLLLVLAIAIGVFALTYSRTWQRSQVDQAEYATGRTCWWSRARFPALRDPRACVRLPWLGAEPLPAATYEFDLGRFSRETGNLLAIDARRGAEVIRAREDFAERPLDDMLAPLATERGALATLPLPGKPTALALSMRLIARARRRRRRPSSSGVAARQPSRRPSISVTPTASCSCIASDRSALGASSASRSISCAGFRAAAWPRRAIRSARRAERHLGRPVPRPGAPDSRRGVARRRRGR